MLTEFAAPCGVCRQVMIEFCNPEEFRIILATNEENYQYGWIHATTDTVTLIGTDRYESSAIRETYEFGTVLDNTLSLKNTRTYQFCI